MKKLLFVVLVALMVVPGGGIYAKKKGKRASFVVATFNVRVDTPADGNNAWKYRKDMVNDLVRFHNFDIFGVQEAFAHQMDDICRMEEYDAIGLGRDGGTNGEHSAIVYKKDKFILLDKGDFWYSQTPDVPGKGWDATCCNRICSWGKFKDRESGKVFFFFNSHFDHQGKVARRESSKLLLQRIREIAKGYPVFSVGDYNAEPDSEPMMILVQSGELLNSYETTQTPPYGTSGTFHNYKHQGPFERRIDHILHSAGISVLKYGTLNETPGGRFPSDHYPVMVEVEFQ
jgi:endonuclease/exonuclease/phosphatase family metal-dependent hydrolase